MDEPVDQNTHRLLCQWLEMQRRSASAGAPARTPLDQLRPRQRQDEDWRTASFQQLFDSTAPDFMPIYRAVRQRPQIDAGVVLPGETRLTAG